jgi:hypothetical protein
MKPRCCLHCREPFEPEIHNAWHQRYCPRTACQRARNRASCRKWRRRNPEHFRDDSQRVRDWRQDHPQYWQRERRVFLGADILLPVHHARRGGIGVRIRDRHGITLQHVVLERTREWRAICRGVGVTLQNVVERLRFGAYRGRHEHEDGQVADAGRGRGHGSDGPD